MNTFQQITNLFEILKTRIAAHSKDGSNWYNLWVNSKIELKDDGLYAILPTVYPLFTDKVLCQESDELFFCKFLWMDCNRFTDNNFAVIFLGENIRESTHKLKQILNELNNS